MALTGLTKIQKIGINTATIPTVGGVEGVGIITATTFVGDGSGLTGVTASGSGVIVKDSGALVGTAQTIDFGTNLNISPISAGIITVTNAASATSLTGLSDVTVSSASDGQILKHNGSVFVNTTERSYSQSSVASGSNINLRLTDGSTNDDILITAGSNITFSNVSANGFTIASSGGGGGGGLSNVVEDTTPELGGDLNLNNKFITGSGGINVSGVVTATSFTSSSAILGDYVTHAGDTDTQFGFDTANSYIVKTGGTTRLAVNLSGIQVTGTVAATQLNGAGSAVTNLDAANLASGTIPDARFPSTLPAVSGENLTGVVTSIVAGANITLTGGPTGIVTIASSGGGGGGGVSLANGVDNRVVTATGAAALNGEANLTWDGTTLGVSGNQIVGSVVVGTAVTITNGGINANLVGSAVTAYRLVVGQGGIDGTSKPMISGGSGLDMNYFSGGTAYSNHVFKLLQGGSTIERFRISQHGVFVTGIATATSFVGDLTGDVTGNAATATEATNVTVTANNSADETVYPIFVDGVSGTQGAETDSGLTYNPSTGNLTATKFTGDGSALTGITASGSGILIKHDGNNVGTAGTINFSTNLDVSAISAGIVTVTASGGGVSLASDADNRVVTATGSGGIQGESALTFDGTSLGIAGGSTDGVVIEQGAIKIKNGGSVSYVDFYCESSNAHRVRLESPAHSDFSGNPDVVLPNTSGNLAVLTNASDNRVITASGTHSMNGESNLTFNGSTLTVTGSVSATSFSGSGTNLTSLPSGQLTGALPAISGASLTNLPTIAGVWTVSHSGSSYYVISGPGGYNGNASDTNDRNSTLYLVRGQTYQFNMSASGHGFGIQTVDGAWTGSNAYTTGITNAGASTGTITFEVPYDAPARLYYACTAYHSNMHGDIYIRGANGDDEGLGDISATSFSGSIAASNIDSGTLGTARIPNLAASKITSGTFGTDRIPDLAASKITSGTFDAARVPNLNASKINAGTLDAARIPDLGTAKITSGTFDAARIPNLNASKITAGTLGTDRIPDLNADKITAGTLGADRIPNLGAAKITSGTFDAARIPNLAASKITSGTLGTARIPNLAASKITSGTLDRDTTGNAATATTSTKVTVTDNENTNEDNLITFVEDATSTTGSVGLEMDGNLTYNPSSGTLKATVFSGSGASLTNLPADELTGTISDARLPSTISSDITGNAASADTIDVSTTSSTANHFVTFVDQSGSGKTLRGDSGIIYNPSSNNLAVSGDMTATNVTATSALKAGSYSNISSGTALSTSSPLILDETAVGSSSAIEYTIFASHTSSGIQSQKVLIMDNGSTAYSNEFAVMFSSSLLVSFSADVNGGNVRLIATKESGISGTSTITYKFSKTIIN